jgi:hypothetical protein
VSLHGLQPATCVSPRLQYGSQQGRKQAKTINAAACPEELNLKDRKKKDYYNIKRNKTNWKESI